MKIEVTLSEDYLRVFISDVLHLSIFKPYLFAFQAWVEDNGTYCVRYYTKHGNIDSLYHDREMWVEVINKVSKYL